MDQVHSDRLIGAALLNSVDRDRADGPSLVLAITASVMHVVADKLLREVAVALTGRRDASAMLALDGWARQAMLAGGNEAAEAAMNMLATRMVDLVEAIALEVRDVRRGAA